jgi:hypothetical protein
LRLCGCANLCWYELLDLKRRTKTHKDTDNLCHEV